MNPEGSRNADGSRGGAISLGDKLTRGHVDKGSNQLNSKGSRRAEDWLGLWVGRRLPSPPFETEVAKLLGLS